MTSEGGTSRLALLLMDYQEAICRESGTIGASGCGAEVVRRGVLANAARVLARCRALGTPVIHVRVGFDPDYSNMTSASRRFQSMRKAGLLQDADPASAICGEVAPLPGEPVIRKGCVNPFVGTALQPLLTRLGVSELALGGVVTNHVVESAARFAADSGYAVTVLDDLCASYNEQLHDFAIKNTLPMYARIATASEFLAELEGGGR